MKNKVSLLTVASIAVILAIVISIPTKRRALAQVGFASTGVSNLAHDNANLVGTLHSGPGESIHRPKLEWGCHPNGARRGWD